MMHPLLFFLITILCVPATSYAMYGQPNMYGQPTMMSRLNPFSDANQNKAMIKDQRTDLAKIEDNIKDLEDYLTREGILLFYTRIKDAYNANINIENRYVQYIKSTTSKTIKAPAGYRLPEFRYSFVPLSEVLDKYEKVVDILDEHQRAENALTPDAISKTERICEIRDPIAKYKKNLDTATSTPDQKVRIENASTKVDNIKTQVDLVRQGLEIYLYHMGISDVGLKENPNDMKDMAEDIEKIIEEINKDPITNAIESMMIKRYSGSADMNVNPYTFPLNNPTKTSYAGVSFADIPKVIIEYQQKMFAHDKEIREKAIKEDKKFFTTKAIPPSFEQMMNSTLVHEYMYDGYLGYWLQEIVNKMHEFKMAGLNIIQHRLTLSSLISKMESQYLSPLFMLADDSFKNIPIIADHTAPQIDTGPIEAALTSLSTEPFTDALKSGWQATLKELKETCIKIGTPSPEAAQIFTLRTTETSGVPAVYEVFLMRRTIMLIEYFSARISGKPFTKDTYKNDFLGPIPTGLWPEIL